MKRAMPWSDKEDDSSSDESSASESDDGSNSTAKIKPKGQSKPSQGIYLPVFVNMYVYLYK